MPYLPILLGVVFAVFYYRAAEIENESALIWSGLSVAISATTLFWLHWGLLGAIAAQVGLFFAITLVRVLRKSD